MVNSNHPKPRRFAVSEKTRSLIRFLFLSAVLCCVAAASAGCHSTQTQLTEPSVEIPRESTVVSMPTETTTPEETISDNKFQLGTEGPLSFEDVRLENGDKTFNSKNHHNALVHCYYPVFSGSAAAKVINADVLRIAEAFTYTYTREEITKPHSAFGMTYAFSHIGYIEPTFNGQGLLSLLLDYNGFWGEDHIYEGGYAGYVYSLATGERLTLTELTGLPEEQLLTLLQKEADRCIQDYLQRMKNLELTDQSLVQTDHLTLEDFGFYITEDGQIQATLNGIHMRKPEPARGYWVSFRFPIGYSIF